MPARTRPAPGELIGPSKATYPAVLNPFLFDGAQYVASGRVTAMAISPTCTPGKCTLYVAAAGGGVWRTDKALNGSNWQFVSGSFGTNAIGSLLIDPSDPSGNTLYAGTGEPNASGDSEAGVGIYKTTNGGQTWTLVPGSDIFFQRAIGQMALDNAGNLLVPIASAVRGISSVIERRLSSGNAAHPLATRGLYRQTGATFTLIRPIVAVATARGSTHGQGRSDARRASSTSTSSRAGSGARSTTARPGRRSRRRSTPTLSTDRAEFDVTTLPNGNTRMYVGVGNQTDAGANRARFYRTDDAVGCGGVHRHDDGAEHRLLHRPVLVRQRRLHAGRARRTSCIWAARSPTASCTAPSNGRAWLLSTDGGATWSDLTQDGDPQSRRGHPSRPARDRHGARQAAAVHHRLGRRRRPLGRQVRRHLGQVRHARA